MEEHDIVEILGPLKDDTDYLNNKLCDQDDEDYMEYDPDQSGWSYLPDLIMEKIFSYLSIRDKYWASMTCKRWYFAFHLPNTWANFVFTETTLTRQKYNYYSGWQDFLDHARTFMCLSAVGKHFKVLEFKPMHNFHNMYDFMNMLTYQAEMQGTDDRVSEGVCSKVHTLRYVFPCNMTATHPDAEIDRLYGTGGKLLQMVKKLMRSLTNLRHLELVDLMLDRWEALNLLNELCTDCCLTLKTLKLVNPTKYNCQLLHVGTFLKLQKLVITPQNLGEDVIYLLSQTPLRHLHILQNRYSPSEVSSVSAKAWTECKKFNPGLRVHLTEESMKERTLVWQEKAPVASVVFNSPYCRLDAESIVRAMEWYGPYLRVYGHLSLPKYLEPDATDLSTSTDPLLLMLCKSCPNLNTLVVRERISTASLLLMVENCTALKWFYVRRDAVVAQCDWPRNPDWTTEFYIWLQTSSRSLNKTEQAIASKLGLTRWNMLSDQEFETINLRLYQDP